MIAANEMAVIARRIAVTSPMPRAAGNLSERRSAASSERSAANIGFRFPVRMDRLRGNGMDRGATPAPIAAPVPRPMTRRAALGRLAAGCGALAAGCRAPVEPVIGACPELAGRRIRWLVGSSPGGGFDQLSRAVAPALERVLNAQVRVENLTGASGLIAAHRLSRARPGGRTVGILSAAGFVVLPFVSPQHGLDPERDFDVLARIGTGRPALAVSASLGAQTLEEVVRRREMLVLGRSGPMSFGTLTGPVLAEMLGIEVRLVGGYRGSMPRVAAAERGEIDALVADEESVMGRPGLIPVLRLTESHGSALRERTPALTGPGSFIETHPELFHDPAAARWQASAMEAVAAAGRIAAAPAGLHESLRTCLETAVFDAATSPDAAENARRLRRVIAPLPAAEARGAIRAGREAAARLQHLLDGVRQGAGA